MPYTYIFEIDVGCYVMSKSCHHHHKEHVYVFMYKLKVQLCIYNIICTAKATNTDYTEHIKR